MSSHRGLRRSQVAFWAHTSGIPGGYHIASRILPGLKRISLRESRQALDCMVFGSQGVVFQEPAACVPGSRELHQGARRAEHGQPPQLPGDERAIEGGRKLYMAPLDCGGRHSFSTWTRVTSLARARDEAAQQEDFHRAHALQARAGGNRTGGRVSSEVCGRKNTRALHQVSYQRSFLSLHFSLGIAQHSECPQESLTIFGMSE